MATLWLKTVYGAVPAAVLIVLLLLLTL